MKRKIEVRESGGAVREILVEGRRNTQKSYGSLTAGSASEIPWDNMLGPTDWMRLTGEAPEKDRLLLVWREAHDLNWFFLIPYHRIPILWAQGVLEIQDLYLDLEHEDGNKDDATKLLGLIYCAVNTVPRFNTLTYCGVSWPINKITGMWGKYLVKPEQVDKGRVGLVVCAGSVAPPESESA